VAIPDLETPTAYPTDYRQGYHRPMPILRIDPNTAPQAVIEALPHVGPAVAGRWIEEREKKRFESLEDLRTRVKGIGPSLWRLISPNLREPKDQKPQGEQQHQPGPWDEQPGLIREALGLGPPSKGVFGTQTGQYPQPAPDSRGPETSFPPDNRTKPLSEEELMSSPAVADDPAAKAKANQARQEGDWMDRHFYTPEQAHAVQVQILNALHKFIRDVLRQPILAPPQPGLPLSANDPDRQLDALAALVALLNEQAQLLAADSHHFADGANNRTAQNMGQM